MENCLLRATRNDPFSSLMIIPTPTFLLCVSKAGSQLILTIPPGGGCQPTYSCSLSTLPCSPPMEFILWNSAKLAPASLNNLVGCVNCPPCTTSFLHNQMQCATTANNSTSTLSQCVNTSLKIYKKSCAPILIFCSLILQMPHTSLATGQFQQVCFLPQAYWTQHIFTNTPSKQILFCWKQVMTCPPHVHLHRTWYIQIPTYLPLLICFPMSGTTQFKPRFPIHPYVISTAYSENTILCAFPN
jgi:hypothetical protein